MRGTTTLGVLVLLSVALGCARHSQGIISGLDRGFRELGRNTMAEGPNSDGRYGGAFKPPTEADLAAQRDRSSGSTNGTSWR